MAPPLAPPLTPAKPDLEDMEARKREHAARYFGRDRIRIDSGGE